MRAVRLAIAFVALGLLLSGCDRCGDWYSPFENPFKPAPNACRDDGNKPK